MQVSSQFLSLLLLFLENVQSVKTQHISLFAGIIFQLSYFLKRPESIALFCSMSRYSAGWNASTTKFILCFIFWLYEDGCPSLQVDIRCQSYLIFSPLFFFFFFLLKYVFEMLRS